MVSFVKKLRQASTAEGRVEPPKVVFGIQCVLGGTEAEAKRHQADIFDRMPLDAALSRMSGTLGIDFSKIDLDTPLAANTTDASRGMLMALANMTGDGNATARDAARVFGATCGMPQLVGTPEQVASQMEHLWRASDCHGFNITPTTSSKSVEDFVDEVVPLLQARGVFRTDYESETFRDNLMN